MLESAILQRAAFSTRLLTIEANVVVGQEPRLASVATNCDLNSTEARLHDLHLQAPKQLLSRLTIPANQAPELPKARPHLICQSSYEPMLLDISRKQDLHTGGG